MSLGTERWVDEALGCVLWYKDSGVGPHRKNRVSHTKLEDVLLLLKRWKETLKI